MTMLRGYAVLKLCPRDEGDDRPFCIVRVEVDTSYDTTTHTIVADHGSYNIARYWTYQLNEGSETEESVKRKIAEGATFSPRRG